MLDFRLKKLFDPICVLVGLWFFSGFSIGIGQEIRHGCQFLHSLIRALGHLPGGLSRFIPCQAGAHHARLLHLGWGRYGHGLTSRPRESCDHQFLTPLLKFFGYPDGAVTELFAGTPTAKRWKRLVPPGTGHLGIKDDVPPFPFPRTGVG